MEGLQQIPEIENEKLIRISDANQFRYDSEANQQKEKVSVPSQMVPFTDSMAKPQKQYGPLSLLHPKLQSLQRISYETSKQDENEHSLTHDNDPYIYQATIMEEQKSQSNPIVKSMSRSGKQVSGFKSQLPPTDNFSKQSSRLSKFSQDQNGHLIQSSKNFSSVNHQQKSEIPKRNSHIPPLSIPATSNVDATNPIISNSQKLSSQQNKSKQALANETVLNKNQIYTNQLSVRSQAVDAKLLSGSQESQKELKIHESTNNQDFNSKGSMQLSAHFGDGTIVAPSANDTQRQLINQNQLLGKSEGFGHYEEHLIKTNNKVRDDQTQNKFDGYKKAFKHIDVSSNMNYTSANVMRPIRINYEMIDQQPDLPNDENQKEISFADSYPLDDQNNNLEKKYHINEQIESNQSDKIVSESASKLPFDIIHIPNTDIRHLKTPRRSSHYVNDSQQFKRIKISGENSSKSNLDQSRLMSMQRGMQSVRNDSQMGHQTMRNININNSDFNDKEMADISQCSARDSEDINLLSSQSYVNRLFTNPNIFKKTTTFNNNVKSTFFANKIKGQVSTIVESNSQNQDIAMNTQRSIDVHNPDLNDQQIEDLSQQSVRDPEDINLVSSKQYVNGLLANGQFLKRTATSNSKINVKSPWFINAKKIEVSTILESNSKNQDVAIVTKRSIDINNTDFNDEQIQDLSQQSVRDVEDVNVISSESYVNQLFSKANLLKRTTTVNYDVQSPVFLNNKRVEISTILESNFKNQDVTMRTFRDILHKGLINTSQHGQQQQVIDSSSQRSQFLNFASASEQISNDGALTGRSDQTIIRKVNNNSIKQFQRKKYVNDPKHLKLIEVEEARVRAIEQAEEREKSKFESDTASKFAIYPQEIESKLNHEVNDLDDQQANAKAYIGYESQRYLQTDSKQQDDHQANAKAYIGYESQRDQKTDSKQDQVVESSIKSELMERESFQNSTEYDYKINNNEAEQYVFEIFNRISKRNQTLTNGKGELNQNLSNSVYNLELQKMDTNEEVLKFIPKSGGREKENTNGSNSRTNSRQKSRPKSRANKSTRQYLHLGQDQKHDDSTHRTFSAISQNRKPHYSIYSQMKLDNSIYSRSKYKKDKSVYPHKAQIQTSNGSIISQDGFQKDTSIHSKSLSKITIRPVGKAQQNEPIVEDNSMNETIIGKEDDKSSNIDLIMDLNLKASNISQNLHSLECYPTLKKVDTTSEIQSHIDVPSQKPVIVKQITGRSYHQSNRSHLGMSEKSVSEIGVSVSSKDIRENVCTDYIADLFNQVEQRSQNQLTNIRQRQQKEQIAELVNKIIRMIEIWFVDQFRLLNQEIKFKKEQQELEIKIKQEQEELERKIKQEQLELEQRRIQQEQEEQTRKIKEQQELMDQERQIKLQQEELERKLKQEQEELENIRKKEEEELERRRIQEQEESEKKRKEEQEEQLRKWKEEEEELDRKRKEEWEELKMKQIQEQIEQENRRIRVDALFRHLLYCYKFKAIMKRMGRIRKTRTSAQTASKQMNLTDEGQASELLLDQRKSTFFVTVNNLNQEPNHNVTYQQEPVPERSQHFRDESDIINVNRQRDLKFYEESEFESLKKAMVASEQSEQMTDVNHFNQYQTQFGSTAHLLRNRISEHEQFSKAKSQEELIELHPVQPNNLMVQQIDDQFDQKLRNEREQNMNNIRVDEGENSEVQLLRQHIQQQLATRIHAMFQQFRKSSIKSIVSRQSYARPPKPKASLRAEMINLGNALVTPRIQLDEVPGCHIQTIPLFQFIPGHSNYVDDFVNGFSLFETLPQQEITNCDDSFIKIEVTPEIQNLVEEFNQNRSQSASVGKTHLKVPKSQVQGFKNPKLILMPNQQMSPQQNNGQLQGSYWMIVDEDDEENSQQQQLGSELEEDAIIQQIQEEQKPEQLFTRSISRKDFRLKKNLRPSTLRTLLEEQQLVANSQAQKIMNPPDNSKYYKSRLKSKNKDESRQTSLVKIGNQNDQDLIIFQPHSPINNNPVKKFNLCTPRRFKRSPASVNNFKKSSSVKYFDYLKIQKPGRKQPKQSGREQIQKKPGTQAKQLHAIERLSQGTSSDINHLSVQEQISIKQLRRDANIDRINKREERNQTNHHQKMKDLKSNIIVGQPKREKYISLDNSEYNLKQLTEQSQKLQKDLGLLNQNKKMNTQDFIEIGKIYSVKDNDSLEQDFTATSGTGFNNFRQSQYTASTPQLKLAMFRTTSGPIFKRHGKQLERVMNYQQRQTNITPQSLNTIYSKFKFDDNNEKDQQPQLTRGASESRPTYDGYQRTSAQSILKMIGQPVFLEGTPVNGVSSKVSQPKKFLRFKDLHFINKRAIKHFEQMNAMEQQQIYQQQLQLQQNVDSVSRKQPNKIVIRKIKNNQRQ